MTSRYFTLQSVPKEVYPSVAFPGGHKGLAARRLPWISCPKCGKWGVPRIYVTDAKEANPDRLTLASVTDFRTWYGPSVFPGSIDYRGGILKDAIDCDIDRCSWADVIHLVMPKKVYETVLSPYSDWINKVELSDGELILIAPKYSRVEEFCPMPMVTCEECGRGPAFGEVDETAQFFYVGNTNTIAVTEHLVSKIQSRANWFGRGGDVRLEPVE